MHCHLMNNPLQIMSLQDGVLAMFPQEIVSHPFPPSGNDYYEQSSSRQYLNKITTPTLLIHSRDDPFMSVDAIPDLEDLSDSVTMELSNHGGHVGFVSGNTPWNGEYWLEQRIQEKLAA